MLALFLLLAKAIPGTIGATLQALIQEKMNRNTPAMKDNVEAERKTQDEDHFADLERRAAAGDKKAQDEIRAREN